MASDDTEITLGVGKLLGLFFLLAAICGVFFSIGYSLGKSSGREQVLNDQAANAPTVAQGSGSSENKPSAIVPVKSGSEQNGQEPSPPADTRNNLTFYKAVQQSDSPGIAPKPQAASAKKNSTVEEPAAAQKPNDTPPASAASSEVRHSSPVTGAGTFVVQIAALSHEDDAVALAGALRKKSYNVFVVNNPTMNDKFYHVQVGPFASLQEANAMKEKLTSEGYSPMVKR